MPATNTQDALVGERPYYLPTSNEVEVFTAAYRQKLPLMLKGPTGCGKTRLSSTWPIASACP
jgi:MoxR-like ATPase